MADRAGKRDNVLAPIPENIIYHVTDACIQAIKIYAEVHGLIFQIHLIYYDFGNASI